MGNSNDSEIVNLNKQRDELYEIQMRCSEKMESIITQMSAIFIGATASFYAIMSSPISGMTSLGLIGFIICIIINCLSYLVSYWTMHFGIKANDINSPNHQCDGYIADKLSSSIVWMDHISLLVFLFAIISSASGTYTEYSSYVEKKTYRTTENTNRSETKENWNDLMDDKNPNIKSAEPAGYTLPPKPVKNTQNGTKK